MILPRAPAKIRQPAMSNSLCCCFLIASQSITPMKLTATMRMSERRSLPISSEINGIKSLKRVPQAIPLFSMNSNRNQPQSTMASEL